MADLTGDGVNDVDITHAGDSTTIGGAIFTDAVKVGSGTGGYNTFLAIQDNNDAGASEAGFNSDDTPPLDTTNVEMDQAKTHTVLLSSLVVKTVVVNGVPQQFYEFRVDLNEANSGIESNLSLDQFKLYSSSNPDIESLTNNTVNKDGDAAPSLQSQNLIYDMDANGNISVLLSDAGSTGSGTDDYSVLVPVSYFAGLDPTTTYIYLYVEMGAAGTDWGANATFEEWNLENAVTLHGIKFNDLNNNGVRDAGEAGVAGVTIFIDANQNGTLDAGERSTTTDANGNYYFYGVPTGQTFWIDEVIPNGANQTTGAHETVTIAAGASGTIEVDPIGNHYPIPSITIDKSASVPGDCVDTVGEDITYTVTVTNNGELALEHVVLKDSFEGGSQVTIGSPTGDVGNDGILSVGETWTYTYTHTVTQEDIDSDGYGNDQIDNLATVTSDPVGSSTTNVTDSDDASVPVCQNPALTIDKSASVPGDCVDTVGENVTYTVTLTNTGNVALDNVVLTDSFEGGSDVTIGSPTGDTGNDGIMDVGEVWTYTYTHTVTQEDIDSDGYGNDQLDNIATANADALNSDTHADAVSDDADVPVCQNPALTIDKSASVPGDCVDTVGENVTYTVTLTNTGNVALDNVVLTDSFEGGSDVTIGSPTGDTGNDGIMDVGEVWTYTYTHTVTQEDIDSDGYGNDQLDNIATANADALNSDTHADAVSDDADVPVCQNPALTIDKSASVPGDCVDTVGEDVTYTVTLTNTGNVALDNVVLTDSFEGGSDVVIGSPTGDVGNDGIMDVGEVWTYTYTHTVTQEDIDSDGYGNDQLDNIATANADALNSDTHADAVSDDADVPICQNPALTIDKSASVPGDCVDTVGEDITYTVTVTNTGNVALDNVVLTDSFEGGSDVTIGSPTGDVGNDGILSVGETWTYTYTHTVTQEDIDSDGYGNDQIDNLATATADTIDTDIAADAVSDDADVPVCQNPALTIDKSASVPGDCVDTVGEDVTYTVTLTNTGNVALDNVVLTDSFEGGSDVVIGSPTGDTGNDGIMDVGEVWTYTYTHTVTQEDIDSDGYGNDQLDNIATANADALNSDTHADAVSDDADVPVCQNPGVDLEKYVSVDPTAIPPSAGDSSWDDADAALGPQDVNIGADVWFKVTIENTGNVTLTNVDVTDTNNSNGTTGSPELLIEDGALTQFALDHGATSIDGDDGNGFLDVGETWTVIYSQGFDAGDHVNTAEVTTDEGVSDSDDAHYFSLVDLGPCPRTPGFWQNPKNGGAFWDGVVGDKIELKHAGEHDFPTGELLYAVDSNHDGSITSADKAGLLIGDWNKDGLTNNGEDTLFISYDDARALINASNKQLNSLSGDGKYMLGRDMVAAWLNYEMGAGFGDGSDPQDPHSYLQDAIDYMQIYGGKTAGGTSEVFDEFVLAGPIKTSSPIWKQVQNGLDHSGAQLHAALDYYNNTGMTSPGGTLYANCGDQFDQALAIYEAGLTTSHTTMMALSSTKLAPTSTTSLSTSTVPVHLATTDVSSFELGSMQHLTSYDLI